jgi:hypothetical protein
MDPQAPNVPPPEPEEPVVPKTSPFKEISPVTIISVAIFILLALGAIVFLYYQNQQLKNMLANYQSQPTSSPTPAATADPTANWKTYTDSNGKYSFKYPQDYKINENKTVSGVDGVSSPAPNTVQIISSVVESTNGNFSITIMHKDTSSDLQAFVSANSSCTSVTPASGTAYKIDSINGLIFKNTPCGPNGSTLLYFVNNKIGYVITIESTIDDNTTELYSNQILSTFKFMPAVSTTPSTLNTIKSACIVLEGSSKAWDDIYKECDEGGATKTQLQTFCTTYGGKFEDNVDVCRHTTGPCGPTYTCSFSTNQ